MLFYNIYLGYKNNKSYTIMNRMCKSCAQIVYLNAQNIKHAEIKLLGLLLCSLLPVSLLTLPPLSKTIIVYNPFY